MTLSTRNVMKVYKLFLQQIVYKIYVGSFKETNILRKHLTVKEQVDPLEHYSTGI